MGTVLLVLLKILQTIGIILLSVVAIILLVLALILFVPFKYKVEGYYEDSDYMAKVKVTWLFHFINVCFDYSKEKGQNLIIKILGIRLKEKEPKEKALKAKSGNKKVKKNKNKDKDKDKDKESSDYQPITDSDDSSVNDNKNREIEEVSQNVIIDSEDIIIIEDELDDKIDENIESGKDKEKSKKQKVSKDKEKYGKINKYLDILKSDEFKRAFELCKGQLVKIIKSILPRKWKATLKLSFTDPEKYGYAMAAYGVLFALIYNHVDFDCQADEDYIRVKGYAKGRLFIITIVVVGLKIFFNRNIRKIIKMFKAEE